MSESESYFGEATLLAFDNFRWDGGVRGSGSGRRCGGKALGMAASKDVSYELAGDIGASALL